MELFYFWEDFIIETLEKGNGICKRTHIAYTPLDVSIPAEVWNEGLGLDWKAINYVGSRKVLNMARWYYPEGLKETLQAGINRSNRKYASVAASMVGQDKNVRGSQGHCIQAISATRHYDDIYISLFYRSVDLCRAWIADLKFFSEVVIPEVTKGMNGKLKQVSFHFSNANIEGVTGIYYLIQSNHDREFLKFLEARSLSTLLCMLKFIYPLYDDAGYYTMLKRAYRQQLFWEDNIGKKPELEDLMKQYFTKHKLWRNP